MSNPGIEQDRGKLQRNLPLLAAIIAVSTLCILLYQFRQVSATVSDLTEFLAATKMAASGHGAQIYLVQELLNTEHSLYPIRGDVVFFIPPFGLPLLMPLALLAPNTAPDVWKGFLVVCFGLSLWVLQKCFKLSRIATCWLIAAICLSGCTYDALRLDQTTTFMLLGFSLAILALKRSRPNFAGIALSSMLLKPQLLLPLLFFLLGTKQYRCLGVFALCAVLLTGIGVALVGIDGLHNYLALMQSTVFSDQYLGTRFSCTLRGQLFRALPEYRLGVHCFCMVIVAITCVWAFKVGRERAHMKNWLDYGLFVVVPLAVVTALYCFFYDVLLLAPTMLACLHTFRRELPSWSLWGCLLLILFFMPPISNYFHYEWTLKNQIFNPQFAALAAFSVGSIVLYQTLLKDRTNQF